MYVDHDIAGLAPRTIDERVDNGERAVRGVHEHRADQVDDGHTKSAGHVQHDVSPAGRSDRQVVGAQHPWIGFEQREQVGLAQRVVAPGQHVDTCVEQLRGLAGRRPRTACRVLRIDDDHGRPVGRAQFGQLRQERGESDRAEHVTDEQDAQWVGGVTHKPTRRTSICTWLPDPETYLAISGRATCKRSVASRT